VQQTIAFWKSHLEPVPQPARERSAAREIVATLYANDPTRAAELLAPYTAANPRDAEAQRQYARVLVQLQRFAAADSAYHRAWLLDSTHPGLLSSMGQMRIGQQRWAEGADLLQRAIAGGVEHSMIYGQLAWAQLHLGRNAEAVRSYERAFELGIPPGRSTRGIAWYNLACAYARLGETDRAIAALEQAFSEGVNERRTYEQDTDLASLRGNARFVALLGRMGG
jgi:tetratricopeptide (TPR) repeat protein